MWLTLVRWIGVHRVVLVAVAVGVMLGGLVWGVWCIRDAGYQAGRADVQARWDAAVREADRQARAQERLVQRAVDAIGARLSGDLARLRIEHKTINRRIVDEVQRVPVYSDCILTDSVWHDLNRLRAATGAGDAGGGGAVVSAAAADR